MVYGGRDKAQVTESLRFLVDNAYITVDNNEKGLGHKHVL
jgi:hypothetical protein